MRKTKLPKEEYSKWNMKRITIGIIIMLSSITITIVTYCLNHEEIIFISSFMALIFFGGACSVIFSKGSLTEWELMKMEVEQIEWEREQNLKEKRRREKRTGIKESAKEYLRRQNK